jgi:LAS superfamily LD-carboxypeptidase LdcB
VKAGALSLATVAAASLGLIGCRSVSATLPTDAPASPRITTTWKADGAVTRADGVLPDGVTVFEDRFPGIANLDDNLLQALRQAATRARRDGVEFVAHSAWRSREYQNQLLREAVSTYGSRKKAARWVATADTSPHVAGDAVDLEPAARAWLSAHGARYGLCRIYRNEPWHFELRPAAIDHGCPDPYANPTKDPRMKG